MPTWIIPKLRDITIQHHHFTLSAAYQPLNLLPIRHTSCQGATTNYASSLAALNEDPSSMNEEKVKSKLPQLDSLFPPASLRELIKKQRLLTGPRSYFGYPGLRLEGQPLTCPRPHV